MTPEPPVPVTPAPLPGDETKPDLSDLPESPVPADRVLAIDPEDPERKITT